MAVSQRLRFEILRRDNHACRYCGATAPDVKLVVDHVTPTALGGTDAPSNLITACWPCNSGKSSVSPDASLVADVASDAVRWSAAIKQAAAELEAQEGPKEAYRKAFKKAWDAWKYQVDGRSKTFDLDPEWRTSLERFRQAGLPTTVWVDIVDRAMTNKTVRPDNLFRYCCGIAWRMITDLQDRARQIVGAAQEPASSADEERDVFADALLQTWVDEWNGELSNAQGRAFEESISRAREADSPESFHRLAEAAAYSALFNMTDIASGLASMDIDAAAIQWMNGWVAATGKYPEDGHERVTSQAVALVAANVPVSRIVRAAAYAGATQSTRLYLGLTTSDLAEIGQDPLLVRVCEIWAQAYQATANRRPSPEERICVLGVIERVVSDGDYFQDDLYAAAAMAGAYQDTDLSLCLPRRLSAVDAVSRPLGSGL